MRKYGLFFVILIMISTTVMLPDIYIKEKFQTGTLSNQPQKDLSGETENEFWIGKNRGTAITKNRIIILDKNEKRIFFILPASRIYVEGRLPMDAQVIRSTEAGALLQQVEFGMAVTPTDEKQTIKGRQCKKYRVDNWILENGKRKGELTRTLWITGTVPFDLDLYWELVTHILRLVSDSEDFFRELEKIKGFPMVSESFREVQGTTIKTRQEVVEIAEKTPPAGIYAIPSGYTRQETLSLPDLLTLLKD
jgi:hypothetical protein